MTLNNWYCPLPFKHAYVDVTGVSPCCQIRRQDTTLAEWHNNSFLKEIQHSMLTKTRHQACRGCLQSEVVQGRSLRTDSLRDYKHEQFASLDIDFVDYRSSNLCNFKCRSCNSVFSHGIAQEVRQNPTLEKYQELFDEKRLSVTGQNRDWIIQNLSKLKRIMFTGGEPTVMPEVKEIITHIQNKNLNHVQILITSNGSWTDSFWYEFTLKYPNLHWTISIDATDKAASIIRHGTNWPQVKYNAEWLAKHSNSLDINTVITNLNVLHLQPLLEFTKHLQSLSRSPTGKHGSLGCRHQFCITHRPYHLSADNWPDYLQSKVETYLENCLSLVLDNEQHNTINGLLESIKNSKFDELLWRKNVEYNTILDNIRNESYQDLYRI